MVELIKRLSSKQKNNILQHYNKMTQNGFSFSTKKICIEGLIFENTIKQEERITAQKLGIDVTTLFNEFTDNQFKDFIKNIKGV